MRLVFPPGNFDAWFAPTAAKSDRQNSVIFTHQNSITYASKRVIHANTTLRRLDLTRLGLAVPLVDEIYAAPLDLWAREHGYTKIELNLVGL